MAIAVMAFECWINRSPHRTVVNATSLGKAKSQFQRDCLYDLDVPFTAIRARQLSNSAATSSEFRRVAEYRGLPGVRCGDAVTIDNDRGVIVGHNSSANFDVLFQTGRYAGQVLNVHPHSLRFPEVRA